MNYESWRISFQNSEDAARAAYAAYCAAHNTAARVLRERSVIGQENARYRFYLSKIQVTAGAFPVDKLILRYANEALQKEEAKGTGDEWVIEVRPEYRPGRGRFEAKQRRGYTNQVELANRYDEIGALTAAELHPEKYRAVKASLVLEDPQL